METLLLISKIIAALIFLVIAYLLLNLACQSHEFKAELIQLEQELKKNYSDMVAKSSLILSFIVEKFAGPKDKLPWWLSLFAFSPLRDKVKKYSKPMSKFMEFVNEL